MKWKKQKSDSFEDRRAISGGRKAAVGGGIIGVVILLLNAFGGDTGQMIGSGLEMFNQTQEQNQNTQTRELSDAEQQMGDFTESVFVYNNATWQKIFTENNIGTYQKPGMVLFSESVETACGSASASSGPFYCPADQKVYMDLVFFEELRTRFGAKGGDFAIAYVIAHEVGHHVQTLLGTSKKIRQLQQNRNEIEGNKLSVALELQADFYAGLWAHYNKKLLEAGDIEEALSAAHAVGDDAIQSKMQGHVNQESFTHGSSEQRMKWFMKGYESGDIREHDTFSQL
ncbi:neutral zinc metallopeptidase [uncultured Flavobacterium sp.]|uniref:KPN_02809 family neutral zinc metallopeptidase n=1 Tax=uncultured Flavobacterium sp. TaxID=165435 RepID=UPI0030CA1426|tara:strand:- start:281 stop:1135 length:855 start_codon:yes stop_codon:yes gene_type:complete